MYWGESSRNFLLFDRSFCHKFFRISCLQNPLKSYFSSYQSESSYTYLDYFLALKCCRPLSEETDIPCEHRVWGSRKLYSKKRMQVVLVSIFLPVEPCCLFLLVSFILVLLLVCQTNFLKDLLLKKEPNTIFHPFLVVLLTEVDKLTKDAQHALRRTMEKYMATCRLILCCNSTSKIIGPIQSRCLAVRVPAPSIEDVCWSIISY